MEANDRTAIDRSNEEGIIKRRDGGGLQGTAEWCGVDDDGGAEELDKTEGLSSKFPGMRATSTVRLTFTLCPKIIREA